MAECGGTTPGPSYKLGNLTGYDKHDYTKNRAPAYSLGLKNTVKPAFTTPGPYNVGKVDRNGRYPYLGWTMESKGALPDDKLSRPLLEQLLPLFTLPGLLRRFTITLSTYLQPLTMPTVTMVGETSDKVIVTWRNSPGKPFGPSPLSYAPEKMKHYTPAYSLGLKPPPKDSSFGPSAADYFPQYPSKPGYTIGHPWKDFKTFIPPGPKAAVPTELYKTRAPAYSLGLKGRPLFNTGIGPGPKYYPGRICHQVPHSYSFGMKHGKCSPPLITYEDNN